MYTDYVDYDYNDNNNDNDNNDYYQDDNQNKLKKIAFIVLIFVILVLLIILIVKVVNNKKTSGNDNKTTTQLIISKASLNLEVGEMFQLLAKIEPQTDSSTIFEWVSRDENVATVDDNGYVTAIAEGETEITVSYGKAYTQTCVVTVTSNQTPITSISLGDDVTLKVGETHLLQVNVLPTDAKTNNLIFKSDNIEVASVDENGFIKANDLGQTIIQVTTLDGSVSDSINVKVVEESSTPITPIETPEPYVPSVINPTGLKVLGASDIITVGGSSSMVYYLEPENATDKTLTWTSSNTGIADVDSDGKVTGISAGKCIIMAKTGNGISSSVEVQVVASTPAEPTVISVQGVTINNGSTLSMKVKDTNRIYYTITPENATNKQVKFTSSDSSVVMVLSNGIIAAVKPGSATITVTTEDGAKSASINITVTN